MEPGSREGQRKQEGEDVSTISPCACATFAKAYQPTHSFGINQIIYFWSERGHNWSAHLLERKKTVCMQ